MSPYLIWFLLFILNIIVIPIGISPFEAPKVIIAEILIDIILIIKVVKFKKSNLAHLFSSQTIFLGVIFILSLDQLLLFHPSGNFFGNLIRLQGLFLLWHLLVFSYISRDIRISRIPEAFYYLSFVFLFISTIILGVNQDNRAFATLGEPNALATTVLFILPFIFLRGKRLTKIVFLLATALLIFLSGSRAGLIGFLIEITFITLVNFLKIPMIKSVVVTFIIILLALFLPFAEGGLFENRGVIWQTALQAGFTSPIIGRGFGTIQSSIHQEAIRLNNLVQYQVVDSSHNFILDYWIQGGIVGVISITILIFLTFQGFIRHKKVLETTAFLGIITAMLFNPVSVVNLLAFWWLTGQGFSD